MRLGKAQGRMMDDELIEIARELALLSARLRGRTASNSDDPTITAARHYRRARMRRPSLFNDGDSSDPAWDILIDLYVSAHEGRDVSVSSAAVASLVPATTALRWIERIDQAGLTYRERDPADRRRSLLRLTDRGAEVTRRGLLPLSAPA